jgi:hypothetical protein
MKKLKLYGITAIEINGILIHTCNVRVSNTLENHHICNPYNSTLKPRIITTLVGKKNYRREASMIEFKFTTTDTEKFNSYTSELGRLLKTIAEHNLNLKYAWVQPTVSNDLI